MSRLSLSLPVRLRLALLLPTVAAFAVSLPLLWLLVSGLIERTAASQLLETLPLVAPRVLAALTDDPQDAQAQIAALAAASKVRITVIAEDGRVQADSARSWTQILEMDNHATRAEVMDAKDSGRGWSVRRSATTGLEYVYTARTLRANDGEMVVIRLAQPITALVQLRTWLAASLALATVAALIGLWILLWLLENRLAPSWAQVREGIRGLEEGRFEDPVPIPDQPQLAPIGRLLNRVANRAESRIGELERARVHLETAVASMREGVLVTDREGRTRLANPAFRRLFGLTVDTDGASPLELTRQPAMEDLIVSILEQGENQTTEIEIEMEDGRHLALAGSRLSGGSGVVVVARDVTQVARLSRMRRDFIANVSHELKTPLAAIRGYAETLKDGAVDDTEAAGRFLTRILQQCARLQSILEDLLTLSRLESLEKSREWEPVDLDEVVTAAVETVSPRLLEKKVELELDVEPVPELLGDREALERLVVNLLDNAVKYNREAGSVTVRLQPTGRDQIVLEVSDTGIGIPETSQTRVFERFYRVDKARSREEGGTGLGLAIVKHAAQLHGGRVEVESHLGQGSRFRVFLPLRQLWLPDPHAP